MKSIHEMTESEIIKLRGDDLRYAVAIEFDCVAIPYVERGGDKLDYDIYPIQEIQNTDLLSYKIDIKDLPSDADVTFYKEYNWTENLNAAWNLDSEGLEWGFSERHYDLQVIWVNVTNKENPYTINYQFDLTEFDTKQEAYCVARCIIWLLGRKATKENQNG